MANDPLLNMGIITEIINIACEGVTYWKEFIELRKSITSPDDRTRMFSRYNEYFQESRATELVFLFENPDRVKALDAALKNQFDRVFGADFSGVRIHEGAYADKLTRSMGADAVTIGNNIYFAQGRYAPETEEGLQLLTHELQHVLQFQRGERLEYMEDMAGVEKEAWKSEKAFDMPNVSGYADETESEVTIMPQVYPVPGGDTSKGNKDVTLARQPYAEPDPSPDFMDTSDFFTQRHHPLYEVVFKDGSRLNYTKGEMESLYKGFEEKICEMMREKKFELTEDEYEKKVLKFINALSGNL